jgi:hypothetical protein
MPVEAAQLLLQAVHATNRHMSLLSALLTERSAIVYLLAGQHRKYCLYELTAGLRLHACGNRPQRQSIVCFALTLLLHDNGAWGAIKAKLVKFIAEDWQTSSDMAQRGRALVLLLRVLSSALDAAHNVSGRDTSIDAVNVLRFLCQGVGGENVNIMKGWDTTPIYELLLKDISAVTVTDDQPASADSGTICVNELAVPAIDRHRVHILTPFNGFTSLVPYTSNTSADSGGVADLAYKLAVEKPLLSGLVSRETVIAEIVKYEADKLGVSAKRATDSNCLCIPLGEPLLLNFHFTNRLACELQLNNLVLELTPASSFDISPVSVSLGIGESREVQLRAVPKSLGACTIEAVKWNLSDALSVRQPLQSGLTGKNRKGSVSPAIPNVTVVPQFALLQISVSGLSEELFTGELVHVRVLLTNEGAATAADVCLKSNTPAFIFPDLQTTSIGAERGSCSVFSLENGPISASIEPGQQRTLEAWLRINDAGTHSISLLASYASVGANGIIGFGTTNSPRTSCMNLRVRSTFCGLLFSYMFCLGECFAVHQCFGKAFDASISGEPTNMHCRHCQFTAKASCASTCYAHISNRRRRTWRR